MSSKEKTKMKAVTTYITDEMYDKINQLALLDARSLSNVLNISIQYYIEKHEKLLKRPILKDIKAKKRV